MLNKIGHMKHFLMAGVERGHRVELRQRLPGEHLYYYSVHSAGMKKTMGGQEVVISTNVE